MTTEISHSIAGYYARTYDIERLAALYEETREDVVENKYIAIAVKIQCCAYGLQTDLGL